MENFFGSSVLQLKYGFYTKIQDDFGRDWGAGGVQRGRTSGKDGACRVGVDGGKVTKITAESAGNYRRRQNAAV